MRRRPSAGKRAECCGKLPGAGFLCAAVCAMLGGGGEAVKVGAIPVEAEGRYPFAIASAPLTFLT